MSEIEMRLKRRALRERNARKEAERLLEEKSLQLYAVNNELSRFADRLEIQVQERTRDLEKAILKAEQANNAKSKFLANMSHELRTPLNGILGMISLSLKTALDDDQQRYMTLAQSSVHSLLAVINDILDFSKIEAGKVELSMLDFDLREKVEEIALIQSQVAHDKGIGLHLDSTDLACPLVHGDEVRFRQILDNLINNAIKFSEQGDICIKLSSTVEKDINLVTCSVKDSGPGIPEDKQHMLFDSFTQVDASTTRQHGGTGLGLTIAKQLCHLMQGRIYFHSEEGEGSEFCIAIPFTIASVKANHTEPQPGKNLNAIVFKQKLISRICLAKMLHKFGFNVFVVDSVKSFSELISEHPENFFDYLFIDSLLNESTSQSIELPVNCIKILIVPVGSRPDAEWFQKSGFHACIVTPFSTKELRNIVENSKKSIIPDFKSTDFTVSSQNLSHLTILLVEDDIINQYVAQGMLNALGIKSEVVDSGLKALELLQDERNAFDLLLMDCQMPNLDGFECTKMIRAGKAGEKNKDIPIIALTANVMKSDIEQCFSAGMNAHISKPIILAKLRESLLNNTALPGKGNPKHLISVSNAESQNNTDTKQLANDLNQLLDLLESYDAKSEALIREVVTNNKNFAINKRLQHIHSLTKHYRYEEAAETTTLLLTELQLVIKD